MALRMATRAGEAAEPPAPRVGFAQPARRRPPDAGARARARRPHRESRRWPRRRSARPPDVARASSTASSRTARSRRSRCAPPPRRPAPDADFRAAAARAPIRPRRPRRSPARSTSARFSRRSARRRHRLRQDRGLFRGDRRRAARGPPGAGAAAGNRADRDSASTVSPSASAPPRRMAFGRQPAPARAAVGRGLRPARRSVVVGRARRCSCLFADLGLIVVDEEHEGAYKQEDGVIYNARDMAVVRARIEGAPIVLASATPSLETRVNAEQGRYRWLRLPRPLRRARTARSPRRSTCAARGRRAGAGSRRASSPASRRDWRRASKRCCSSTGAATRR